MITIEKEIENNNNTLYVSDSIRDDIINNGKQASEKLVCFLVSKNSSIEAAVLKYSKSNEKILIDMCVKEKVLADIILENILNLKIQLGEINIASYSAQDYYLNFEISLFEDNIYNVGYELIHRKKSHERKVI